MSELTVKEKEEAEEVINAVMKYFWNKVKNKMASGKSFDDATFEVQEEFLKNE